MFENLPDNGYEFAEEVEQHEKAEERLLWMKRGFAWCYEMTERQREVALYKLFTDETEKDIGIILNISQQAVNKHWQYAVKQGKNVKI
jgi:DNA-directed RNA polymerase specialized sigma subunit